MAFNAGTAIQKRYIGRCLLESQAELVYHPDFKKNNLVWDVLPEFWKWEKELYNFINESPKLFRVNGYEKDADTFNIVSQNLHKLLTEEEFKKLNPHYYKGDIVEIMAPCDFLYADFCGGVIRRYLDKIESFIKQNNLSYFAVTFSEIFRAAGHDKEFQKEIHELDSVGISRADITLDYLRRLLGRVAPHYQEVFHMRYKNDNNINIMNTFGFNLSGIPLKKIFNADYVDMQGEEMKKLIEA